MSELFERAESRLRPFSLLLLRLAMGALFFSSGSGKWAHLERTTAYFASLGIPFPEVQAPFIALLEYAGGLGLVFGVGTRLWSLLLSGTMAVALVTAIAPEAESFLEIAGSSELVLLGGLLVLFTFGAGSVSLDALVAQRLRKPKAEERRRQE